MSVATTSPSALMTAADSGITSATGFDVSGILDWVVENFLKPVIGAAFLLAYDLRYLILALIVVGVIVFIWKRGFGFFGMHG